MTTTKTLVLVALFLAAIPAYAATPAQTSQLQSRLAFLKAELYALQHPIVTATTTNTIVWPTPIPVKTIVTPTTTAPTLIPYAGRPDCYHDGTLKAGDQPFSDMICGG